MSSDEKADGLFQDGLAAVHREDWEEALRSFAASYALVPKGTTLVNVGSAELKLGRLVEAVHHLKEALDMELVDATATPTKRAVAQRAYDAAYAKTGHLALRAPPGTAVMIDAVPVQEVAPFSHPIDVLPGKHRVEAHHVVEVAAQEIDVPPGTITNVDLESMAASASPRTSQVAGPPPETPLEARRGEGPPVTPSRWTGPRIAGVILGGVAVAGFGVGLGFHLAAVNAADDGNVIRHTQLSEGQCVAEPSSAPCESFRSKADAVSRDHVVATVGWTAAAAATAGAAIAFLVGSHAFESKAAGVAVRPTFGLAWFGLEGSF